MGRLALFVSLAVASGAAAGPAGSPWAGFKAGTFVKTRTVTIVKVGAHRVETVTDITQTVIEVKGDRAVVETIASMNGVPRPSRTRSEVSLKEPATPPAGAVRKSGSETLTIAGRTLRCEWSESETDMAGSPTSVRTWTSGQVPGGVAKTFSKNALMESTLEVVAFQVK